MTNPNTKRALVIIPSASTLRARLQWYFPSLNPMAFRLATRNPRSRPATKSSDWLLACHIIKCGMSRDCPAIFGPQGESAVATDFTPNPYLSPFRYRPLQLSEANPGRLRPKERSQPLDNPGVERQRDGREFGPQLGRRWAERVNRSGRARLPERDSKRRRIFANPGKSRG